MLQLDDITMVVHCMIDTYSDLKEQELSRFETCNDYYNA